MTKSMSSPKLPEGHSTSNTHSGSSNLNLYILDETDSVAVSGLYFAKSELTGIESCTSLWLMKL